jgi:hypothetical protein
MDVLRKLSGYLAAVVALAVVVWIGRYSAYAPNAIPSNDPTHSSEHALAATKPSSTGLADKTQPASQAEFKPPAIPEAVPPETLLATGLQSAKRESKLILLQISGTASEQSETLYDFIDDNWRLFRPDFVSVRVEYEHWMRASEQQPAVDKLMQRLRKANSNTIPWIAVLDSAGRVLADSDGPAGNVCYPTTPAEIAYFGEMLRKTTPPGSAARIAKIERQLRADQERWKDAEGHGRLPIEKTVTPRDVAVLSATFKHFAEHEHWLSEHSPDATLVVVDTETKGKYPFTLIRPRENYLNLVGRNAEMVSLRGLSFGKQVLVEKVGDNLGRGGFDFVNQMQKRFPHIQRSCYVRLWLPGYSNDRKTAVIRFSYGPSAHGAAATYVLKNRNGEWIVTKFNLFYFS